MSFASRILGLVSSRFSAPKGPRVAHVRIDGAINAKRTPPQIQTIQSAFKAKNIKAVAVTVNSPGGSPVQSDIIHKRIKALSQQNNLPVYVFVEELAASAGYHIATAGTEIYAHEASMVGSIGVVSMQFGVNKLLNTLGVEPRILHKGENKTMMSPFLEPNPEHRKIMDNLLENMYDVFKNWVRENRKGKLKLDTPELEKEAFSGAVFTPQRGIELGLIDGIGDIYGVLEKKFGPDVQILDVKQRKTMLQFFSDDLPRSALHLLETKALESRYGM